MYLILYLDIPTWNTDIHTDLPLGAQMSLNFVRCTKVHSLFISHITSLYRLQIVKLRNEY